MSEETSTPEAAPTEAPNLSLIASQSFGQNFHGEVQESAPAIEEPVAEVATEEEAPIEAQEETQEAAEEVSEDVPISTLQELIEANEYDPEWLNGLQVDVKVDGTPSKATLSDLVKSYQIQEAAEKRLNEVKEKASTQNQALAQKQEEVTQSLQVAAKLIEKVESKLTSDFEKVDWDGLEKNDPAEWSAQKLKMSERMSELAQMKQDAISEHQQNAQRFQLENQQSTQERLYAEQEALLEKLPEWKDAEVAKTQKAALSEYLVKQGLTQEEIANASDHRIIILAQKAMLYDAAEGAEPAKKRLVKVPRTLKPGAPKTPDQIKQSERQDAIARLRKSGSSIDDALAVWKMK